MNMRRIGVMLSILLFATALAAWQGGNVSATSAGYVLIYLNNNTWYFDNATIQAIDWNFAGIGNYTVYLLNKRTLEIETPTLGDFIKLFAPAGYSTSQYANVVSSTIFDEMLNRINTAGAVKDANGSVNITLKNVTLFNSFNYRTVRVTILIQRSYEGQGYTVNVTAQSPIYALGWRNNRGTVTIDGTDYSQSLYPPYTLIQLGNGTHSITTKTTNTGGEGFTAIELSIIALQSNYTVSGQFNRANYEVTYTFTKPPIFTVNVKDALSKQPLTDVTVKVDNTTYTVSNGDTIMILPGIHNFFVSKSGYNSGKATLNIPLKTEDATISIVMYPVTYPSASTITLGSGAATTGNSVSTGASWSFPAVSGDMGFIAAFVAMIIIGAVMIPLQQYDDGTVTKYVLILLGVAVIAVVAGIVMKWL